MDWLSTASRPDRDRFARANVISQLGFPDATVKRRVKDRSRTKAVSAPTSLGALGNGPAGGLQGIRRGIRVYAAALHVC
jgi:hypothetical protein